MEFMYEYNLPVVFGICLCVGYILKHMIATEKIDKFIPLIVGIMGVTVNMWINAWTITPDILMAGLFSGLASTGAHQAFKQIIDNATMAHK